MEDPRDIINDLHQLIREIQDTHTAIVSMDHDEMQQAFKWEALSSLLHGERYTILAARALEYVNMVYGKEQPEQLLENIIARLNKDQAIAMNASQLTLADIPEREKGLRERAIAITKAEESLLWLEKGLGK